MKKISKMFLGILMVVCMLGFFVSSAPALTFDLNYTVSATPTAVSPSWGTVTITDDGNSVDVLVSPTVDTDWKLLALYLNYAGSATAFTYTSTDFNNPANTSSGSADFSPNGEQADGYTAGKFDIQIPDTGNLGNVSGDVLIVLSANVNLDPSDFDHFDFPNGLLTSAAHFGNAPQGEGGSIWVGSGPGTPPRVPEPGTLMLLGSGLLGLGIFGRKMFGK